jgi:hypothetical protein
VVSGIASRRIQQGGTLLWSDAMLKKIFLLHVLFAPALGLLLLAGGCGDDVKTHRSVEQQHESPPQMVSPGEEVVE